MKNEKRRRSASSVAVPFFIAGLGFRKLSRRGPACLGRGAAKPWSRGAASDRVRFEPLHRADRPVRERGRTREQDLHETAGSGRGDGLVCRQGPSSRRDPRHKGLLQSGRLRGGEPVGGGKRQVRLRQSAILVSGNPVPGILAAGLLVLGGRVLGVLFLGSLVRGPLGPGPSTQVPQMAGLSPGPGTPGMA